MSTHLLYRGKNSFITAPFPSAFPFLSLWALCLYLSVLCCPLLEAVLLSLVILSKQIGSCAWAGPPDGWGKDVLFRDTEYQHLWLFTHQLARGSSLRALGSVSSAREWGWGDPSPILR